MTVQQGHLPSVSVVLPYYENHETLSQCLHCFINQDKLPSTYEIIVIDDGSYHPAKPIVEQCNHKAVTLITQENKGQSAATNIGMKKAKGEIIILSASDIYPERDFVWQHIETHQKNKSTIAVLGYLPYPQELQSDPFMRYLSLDSYQFAFGRIKDPNDVPAQFLYAPNVSIHQSVLSKVGFFDENLPYGYQDTDFGIRLVKNNIRIVYNKNAIGNHIHSSTIDSFSKRLVKIGKSHLYMLKKYNDKADMDKTMQFIIKFAPHIHKLPVLIEDISALNQKLAKQNQVIPHLENRIYKLFKDALDMSLATGILTDINALKSTLSLHESDIQAITVSMQ